MTLDGGFAPKTPGKLTVLAPLLDPCDQHPSMQIPVRLVTNSEHFTCALVPDTVGYPDFDFPYYSNIALWSLPFYGSVILLYACYRRCRYSPKDTIPFVVDSNHTDPLLRERRYRPILSFLTFHSIGHHFQFSTSKATKPKTRDLL